jgi:hypothetical protein
MPVLVCVQFTDDPPVCADTAGCPPVLPTCPRPLHFGQVFEPCSHVSPLPWQIVQLSDVPAAVPAP